MAGRLLMLFLVTSFGAQISLGSRFFPWFSSPNYQRAYDTIDKHLMANVKSDNLRLNMREANSWLASLTKDSGKVDGSRKSLVKALNLFTSLDGLLNEQSCDGKSLVLLDKNNQATRLRAGKKLNIYTPPVRRIDRLVFQSLLEHAKICRFVYPAAIQKFKSQLDEETRDLIEFATRDLIRGRIELNTTDFLELSRQIYSNFILEQPFEAADAQQVAYASIGSPRDWTKRFISPLEGYRDARKLRSGILRACRRFVDHLGPNLFRPAAFDDQVMYRELGSSDNTEFYSAWAQYNICSYLLTFSANELVFGVVEISFRKPKQ